MSWADEAEEQADQLGDAGLRWRARIQRIFVEELTDPEQRVTDTLGLCEQAIAELSDLQDHAALADAYRLRAGVHNQLGRLRAAGDDALEALRHAHQAPPEARRYADLLVLAMAPMETGDDSLGNGERLLDELEAWLGDDPGMRHDIQSLRVWIDAYHGNLDRAEEQLADRFALLLEQGSTLWAASLLSGGIAWCQQWRGDLAACAESLRTAAQMKERAGETWTRSTVLAQLALVLARLGQDEEAQEVLAESRRISQSMDLVNEIYWAAADGLLLARQGSSDDSEGRFEDGLQVAADTEFLFTQAELWLARSDARESLGDLPGAVDAARQALCLFERKGFASPVTAAQARVSLLSELNGLPAQPATRD